MYPHKYSKTPISVPFSTNKMSGAHFLTYEILNKHHKWAPLNSFAPQKRSPSAHQKYIKNYKVALF